MASVAVVLGSIRPGRAGEQVVRWIEEQSLQVEGVTPRAHLREILSTFGADVCDQEIGINLGSDFVDGAFTPSEELSAQLRELLASLA